ncbi:MAG: RdgB/HAM1 family non-canonical purine NTP pyrophosphatase [Gammaproteobacteria bacterium]
MTRIVMASNNAGKLREFTQLLAPLDLQVLPQRDFGIPEADETGLTFVENAILKARNAAAHSGLPAISDDSGIEVDHLNGAPGIYSARYAGEGASDAANLDKLVEALRGVPEEQRTARYQCVIVYLRHAEDPVPIIAQGAWEGRLLDERRGENGFGYDPIFWVPTHGCTSAELDPAVKNGISHRGIALRELLTKLGH